MRVKKIKNYFRKGKNILESVLINIKLKSLNKLILNLKNTKGIEIGGKSEIFENLIPIYSLAESIDGCNYSTETVWEGKIKEGLNYNYFGNKVGYQHIAEASELNTIDSDKYDFLISSHCLEHCANAIKTILEWKRVVKKGGYILIIVPNKKFTFDHKRETTTFNHLLDDYKNEIGENDLTHLQEILQKHDLSLDTAAGTFQEFKNRSLDNFNNRCLHQHVFDITLLKELFRFSEISIVKTLKIKPYHQIIIGRKK